MKSGSGNRILIRIVAGLLVVVLMMATMIMLVSVWLRSTLFSQDWYQQTFSQQTYVTALRAAIEEDLNTQSVYVGIPSDVLFKGLDNDLIYVLLRKHIENTTDFLNFRAPFVLPVYPTEKFSEPLMAYAQELSKQGGITMSAEQDKLLLEIAKDSATSVQNQIGILNLTVIQKSLLFQSIHRALFSISHYSSLAGWVIVITLLLILALFFRRIRRFFNHALVGFWLAGALIGIPLLVLDTFELTRRLSVSPAHLKFAIDQLLTTATNNLMLWSLIILTLTSVILLILFILEHRVQKNGRRSGDRRSNRRKSDELSASGLT